MLVKLGRTFFRLSDGLSFAMVIMALAAITICLARPHGDRHSAGAPLPGSNPDSRPLIQEPLPASKAKPASVPSHFPDTTNSTTTTTTSSSSSFMPALHKPDVSGGNAPTPAVAGINQQASGASTLPDSWKLMDVDGLSVFPLSVCEAGDNLFFLTPQALYRVSNAKKMLAVRQPLFLEKLVPAGLRVGNIPFQELMAFVYLDKKQSLVLLDKSGNLFEYSLTGKWTVLFSNARIFGSPDPHYIDLASMGNSVCLLDPERNQIWKMPYGKSGARYFKEVLPWRIKKGDPNVADGVAIAYDGITYVLRRNGVITGYELLTDGRYTTVNLSAGRGLCPTRLFVKSGTPLYVVDREGCCVVAVDRKTGKQKQFFFPAASDLRGLSAGAQAFMIIDADSLKRCLLTPLSPLPSSLLSSSLSSSSPSSPSSLSSSSSLPSSSPSSPSSLSSSSSLPSSSSLSPSPLSSSSSLPSSSPSSPSSLSSSSSLPSSSSLSPSPLSSSSSLSSSPLPLLQAKAEQRRIATQLKSLRIPIKNASLPRHPGVFPGARRIYRFGIHQGLDFFNDPGAGTHVSLNTEVLAAAPGKVLRADVDFKDMNPAEYARVEADCRLHHFCSEENENKFRGCQVWLDHGQGLVTRYAHLNSVCQDLRPGSVVAGGQTIGYVGVSGTGENPLSTTSHPHLHFEVLLNGKYLGYGLTPSETMCVYKNIFANFSQKGR